MPTPSATTWASFYGLPVWVDNDVNLMALGELRAGHARGEHNMVYVKIGTGIGAGIICAGNLYRGAQGCAGDIGHVAVREASEVICRCGKAGCLEALAGGAALVRDAHAWPPSPALSPHLAAVLAEGRPVTGEEITKAAQRGDPVAMDLLLRSGRLVRRGTGDHRQLLQPGARSWSEGASPPPVTPCWPPSAKTSTAARCLWPPGTCTFPFRPWATKRACGGRRPWSPTRSSRPANIVRWLGHGSPVAMTATLSA